MALFVGLGMRPTLSLAVLRPPGEPFAILPGHVVSNHFTLRVHNMTVEPKQYRIVLDAPPSADLIVPVNPVTFGPGELSRIEAFVNIPYDVVADGRAPLHFRILEGSELRAEAETTFLAPVSP